MNYSEENLCPCCIEPITEDYYTCDLCSMAVCELCVSMLSKGDEGWTVCDSCREG